MSGRCSLPPAWQKQISEAARLRVLKDHAERMHKVLQEVAAMGHGGACARAQEMLRIVDIALRLASFRGRRMPPDVIYTDDPVTAAPTGGNDWSDPIDDLDGFGGDHGL